MVDHHVFVHVVKQCTIGTHHDRMRTGCGGQVAHPAGWPPGHQHDVDLKRGRAVERAAGADADLTFRIEQRAVQVGGDQSRLMLGHLHGLIRRWG